MMACATPQYAVRQTPVPDESPSAIQIERTISAVQAKTFERLGARAIRLGEDLRGFDVQALVDQLSRVTERQSLRYRAFLYPEDDPNAAALADGRIYVSTGMLNYLGSRGSRVDEFAFVLAHELAHTVAQHLVKRYRTLQQQRVLMALVAAGTAAATRNASAGVQQAGQLALDAASLLNDVAISGYSQEQELEADQLGIQYVIRAGLAPSAALDLLQDFARFDTPWPFLRTHPYILVRREHLQRYLAQISVDAPTPPAPTHDVPSRAQRLAHLRQIQRLYPVGSISWRNVQREIERLERAAP